MGENVSARGWDEKLLHQASTYNSLRPQHVNPHPFLCYVVHGGRHFRHRDVRSPVTSGRARAGHLAFSISLSFLFSPPAEPRDQQNLMGEMNFVLLCHLRIEAVCAFVVILLTYPTYLNNRLIISKYFCPIKVYRFSIV